MYYINYVIYIGYPCCETTKDIIYNSNKGSWGYENDSWCGINETEANTVIS